MVLRLFDPLPVVSRATEQCSVKIRGLVLGLNLGVWSRSRSLSFEGDCSSVTYRRREEKEGKGYPCPGLGKWKGGNPTWDIHSFIQLLHLCGPLYLAHSRSDPSFTPSHLHIRPFTTIWGPFTPWWGTYTPLSSTVSGDSGGGLRRLCIFCDCGSA